MDDHLHPSTKLTKNTKNLKLSKRVMGIIYHNATFCGYKDYYAYINKKTSTINIIVNVKKKDGSYTTVEREIRHL
jgi:hypothetical protein